MRRNRTRIGKRRRQKRLTWLALAPLAVLVVVAVGWPIYALLTSQRSQSPVTTTRDSSSAPQAQTARIMAHGDLLYHTPLIRSVLQADGSYNFSENFTYVKPWIEQADLAIADFEGTISSDYPLGGYPLFNAPASVVTAIQETGYDVVDLAHNHILDSHLSGLISTVNAFRTAGVDTVGVYAEGNRATAPLTIREVKGIKIAILGYAYGFNGMEGNLTQEEYEAYLSDLNLDKMQAELARAEVEADFTIVMPQMGTEYQLEPTQEQRDLYHQMVEWGADLVLGGHPHVVEPAEIMEKDGQRKLIIYSMGNFLSDQRIETMDGETNAQWTERGILLDVTLEKTDGATVIKTAQAHPTWVNKTSKGTYTEEGLENYLYQTYILEDFIDSGQYREQLDPETQQRIDTAYLEMQAHVGLNW